MSVIICKSLCVEGVILSIKQLADAVQSMPRNRKFRFLDMQIALAEAGVPKFARYRGADRLIQRLRKQGAIEFNKDRDGLWNWIE